jgi:hypothetical protein
MFIPITAKKISQIIFDLQYYGFPIPEPDLMKMRMGTVILRYNQLMLKVKENKEQENKVLEFLAKHTCPFLSKKK